MKLKIESEAAKQMQTFESLQLAISQALGGEVSTNPRSGTFAKGEEISDMNSMVSMIHHIGGMVG